MTPERIALSIISASAWRVSSADVEGALAVFPAAPRPGGKPPLDERDAAVSAIKARHAAEPFATARDARKWAREQFGHVKRQTLNDWVRAALGDLE